VALAMVGPLPALAVHDTGAFELDGNAVNQSGTPGDDWDNVCHQVTGSAQCGTTSDTSGATAVAWNSDTLLNSASVFAPDPNATIFTGGGSKDPIDINQWAWKDGAGGLPDKDNLQHSFAARYSLAPNASTCPSGGAATCDVLFFGSDRFDNSGDAQQGFWFFQNPVSLNTNAVGGGFGFSGVHRNGDVLVISDFSNGGTTATITVYKWDTSVSGNLRQLATSNAALCSSASHGDTFCGIVNPTNGTPAPWPFTDKSGNHSYLQGEFYEGGLNLSVLGLGQECFSSVASETRSSTSTTATLKDFVLGRFGSCGSSTTTTPKDGSGAAIPSGGLSIGTGSVTARDAATVTVTGTATWTGSVSFHLCGPIASGTCASGGADIGSTPVTQATTQPVLSPVATLTSAGRYCWRGDFTSTTTGVPASSDSSGGECFTVNPVTPTLATQAGTSPVSLGTAISDTATLTGTASAPGTNGPNSTYPSINATNGAPAGGTITFTAFGPNDCSTVAFTSSAVTVSGDGTYGPVNFTPTAAGTYHWAAGYTGQNPNTNATTHNNDCSDTNEDVTVISLPTQVTTAQSFVPNDSATVSVASGGGNLAGSVDFQLFVDSTTCQGTPAYDSGAIDITTGSGTGLSRTVNSANSTAYNASHTFSWLVTYTSSNPSHQNSSSACDVEHSSLSINNNNPNPGQ
jgi:hypothetical protein